MANVDPQPQAKVDYPAPRLSVPVKFAYGLGDLGTGMTSQFMAFFLLIFLTDVAGLRPAIAGSVLAVGKVWDAINDPLVGMMSDRTRTRWGRRYPWMVLTAVPFGLTYMLIWLTPDFGGEWAAFAYYVAITVVFQMFFTTTNLPYSTLTAELTHDYDERTALTSFRLASSVSGGLFILIANVISVQLIPDNEPLRYLALGIVAGVLVMATVLACVFGTFGYAEKRAKSRGESLNGDDTREGVQESFFEQLKIVMSNKPFLYVIGIFLFSWLALQITATVIPFYGKYWVNVRGDYIALAVQGTAVIMMFVCSALSQRIGKRNLYFWGVGSWILVQIALFFLQPGQNALLFTLSVIAGFGVATAYVVPWSILPDVIELDELNTGHRREGMFYSFMTLLQKFGLAIGIYLVGLALDISQFDSELPEGVAQPESALQAIRFFIGPVPLVLLIFGMILVYFYPITKEFHAEVMLKLAERKRLKELEE